MARAGIFGRLAAVVMTGLGFAMGGCEGGGSHPSLAVVRDASLAQQSIEVDVIGTDAEGVTKYTSGDVGKYFSAKSTLRSAAPKHTLKFNAEGADAMTLSSSDPIWKQWGKATNFVLLANIPGMTNKGAADPRRPAPVGRAPVAGTAGPETAQA